MSKKAFKDTNYNLQGLMSKVELGEISLPDIQRPFVWNNARVRDLFDSMYQGFPVGHLLFCSTGAVQTERNIGTDKKQSVPNLLIIDGQQRLTSLFSVIKGTEIVKKNYTKGRIRIAFHPKDRKFDVTDAAIEQDPEFVPDISEVFKPGFRKFLNGFFERLEEHKGNPLDEEEKDIIEENLDRVRDLQHFTFQAIELDQTVDEEKIAEIFVRINSKGVQLKTSDFILTLMSVFQEEGRKELEEFSRQAMNPNPSGQASPFNHFIKPSPELLLRAILGFAFKRARLQSIYPVLRGKDIDTSKFDANKRDAQFAIFAKAQEKALNLTNWHEFLRCLFIAGFRSQRMISSYNAVMYSYMFWLIGKYEFGLDNRRLQKIISQWWFMVHTKARYSSSVESVAESDLNKIKQLPPGDGDAFVKMLSAGIDEEFTEDYWNITLPSRLESSRRNPILIAYWASLNLLNAEMLFSDQKVVDMLDPEVPKVKDMERHHLFPRAYLESIGEKDQSKISQIANTAFVDWLDNAAISEKPPADYWQTMIKGIPEARLKKQMFWHALPEGWEYMPYDAFLKARRKMIAAVVRKGVEKLRGGDAEDTPPTIEERIARGESATLEFKQSARWSLNTEQKRTSEMIIVKAVAGFMNSEGGSLLIGVEDDGRIAGLQEDYATLSKPNRDGYQLFLTQLLQNNLSGAAATLCKFAFHEIDGKEICEVRVSGASKPVFAASINNKEHTDFWLRLGAKTVQYVGTDRQEYIDDHWNYRQ